MRADVASAHAALTGLVGGTIEAAEFSSRVGSALAQVFTFDGWCLFGLDPSSGLRTCQFGGRGTEHAADLANNEALMTDVNRYRDLASAAVPFGILSLDHPQAQHSFRLHEVLLPQGFHSELRLALRDRGLMWGGMTVFREDSRRPFDVHDGDALHSLAAPLTNALRAYSVRPIASRGRAPGTGVVALSPDNEMLDVSTTAQAWLEDLVPGGDDETYVSDVTRVLFDAAHALRRDGADQASTCLRTVSGHWLHVEATALAIKGADVAVILKAPAVHELLGTLATYNRLTTRESQILRLLALGLAGKQIARELTISPATVNRHLTSIYGKCRVVGREQLFGQLI